MDAAAATAPAGQAETVRTSLRLLERRETDAAMELLTEDAVWINVTLPTVRGRRRIDRLIRALTRRGQFRAHFHHLAAQGDVVLTERTDELAVGPFKQRFWVSGRFELRDGKIAVWRDSFDWLDIAVSLARAAAGSSRPVSTGRGRATTSA